MEPNKQGVSKHTRTLNADAYFSIKRQIHWLQPLTEPQKRDPQRTLEPSRHLIRSGRSSRPI
jgi:hypothetical protein